MYKWEYLSWQHAAEFFVPIEISVSQGCLIEPAKVIKVMDYCHNQAQIWLKGESGSTYLAKLWRSSEHSNWQLIRQDSIGKVCTFDVINSTLGGSADGFYWYN